MSKINLLYSLTTLSDTINKNVQAIHHEDLNTYVYNELDEDKTKTTFNYLDNILIRENDKIYMEYPFKESTKTTGKILIKELNSNLNVEIETTRILRCDNKIEIKYIVEKEPYKYIIEVK